MHNIVCITSVTDFNSCYLSNSSDLPILHLTLIRSIPVLITPWFSGSRPRELVEEVKEMLDLNDPRRLPRLLYSALMGLLCSSGATLARGPNN